MHRQFRAIKTSLPLKLVEAATDRAFDFADYWRNTSPIRRSTLSMNSKGRLILAIDMTLILLRIEVLD
jgi:hypothetical protein